MRQRPIHLQFWPTFRTMMVERQAFFVREAKKRLLNQFQDIEGEADRFEEEIWQAAISAPYYGDDPDMGSLAESVRDEAVGHYQLLDEMRDQTRLSTLAAMFHQWDKALREHLAQEFRHYQSSEWIAKNIWKPSASEVFKMFEEFGWEVTKQDFYRHIDACSLIVNVYKHGNGPALTRLHKDYARYLSRDGILSWGGTIFLDHKWLKVTDADFDMFADAITAFWHEMPENLVYTFDETTDDQEVAALAGSLSSGRF